MKLYCRNCRKDIQPRKDENNGGTIIREVCPHCQNVIRTTWREKPKKVNQ